MAFFEQLGKRIADTSQSVAQKTKDAADTVRRNGQIADEQKRLSGLFQQIGQAYYESCQGNPTPSFAGIFSEVNNSRARIVFLAEQGNLISGTTAGAPVAVSATADGLACGQCGAIVPSGKEFCTHCGTRVERLVAEPEPTVAEPAPQAPEVPPTPDVPPMPEVSANSAQTSSTDSEPAVTMCPGCHREVLASATFCPKCGTRIGGIV